MAALSSVSVLSSISNPQLRRTYRRLPTILASSASATPFQESSTQSGSVLSSTSPPKVPFVESSNGNPVVRFVQQTESTIERAIFDFRFLAFFAIGGSLAGSLLCFLNGCVYITEAYKVYWTSCVKGIHSGQMVLKLVEAIDVYLAGTVMFIFGMGLYGLFIANNVSPDASATADRVLKQSSLFGMFALKERPNWMKISSLDELKTRVGHVIVMILLVKMFERSKMVPIATGADLLSYSVCIFLSSASLYILHQLHKSE
ncbi:uncharacterized protein LOC132063186 isoform X1 [Lycium ferocissimum]|uniref:uncharacterized protein LOC132063186 isoform X1 n=1 Tax=Lycium ferocissimum TaxID=112874 RepID=UPI002815DE1F|nr:uncharacterized protein LOC132063186 isoform X1 [Lycium ferocissimum]